MMVDLMESTDPEGMKVSLQNLRVFDEQRSGIVVMGTICRGDFAMSGNWRMHLE